MDDPILFIVGSTLSILLVWAACAAMMSAWWSLRWLLKQIVGSRTLAGLATLLVLGTRSVAAQGQDTSAMEFQGIPWTAEIDEVQHRLEAQGYKIDSTGTTSLKFRGTNPETLVLGYFAVHRAGGVSIMYNRYIDVAINRYKDIVQQNTWKYGPPNGGSPCMRSGDLVNCQSIWTRGDGNQFSVALLVQRTSLDQQVGSPGSATLTMNVQAPR